MEGLHDFAARLLLRYFRAARNASVSAPQVEHVSDLDLLRFHWSVSRTVSDLCEYVVQNRHEVQSSLNERLRTDDAVIRGRLDARRTILARVLSGHPTRVVYAEPVRGYTSGPNHVLIWVLQRAHLLLARFASEAGPSSGYSDKVAHAVRVMEAARRVASVAQAITETDYVQRPSPQSLAQAAASRKALYRLAHAAHARLRSVETGDPEAISGLLKETLLGPLYEWQAFELALALGMGAALAEATMAPLHLRRIAPGGTSAIIEVGELSVHWQSKTQAYVEPTAEPSEVLVSHILNAYGLGSGDDRPDVVVLHRAAGKVVAIGEAKFFTNETEGWRSAFRAAAAQIVRYARGYASGPDLDRLLARSVIGLWRFPVEDRPSVAPFNAPVAVDFPDLIAGALEAWAERLAPAPTPHSAA